MKVLIAALALVSTTSLAATVGKPAPDFSLADVSGKSVKLSDYRGKYVVLEWVNPDCPSVQKHYDSANMQGLQKEFGAKQNVVWLTINSTNADHSEYYPPQKLAGWMKQMNAAPSATLLDPTGKVGRAYDARTTPHMYIVDPQGRLVYAGGIDDKRSTRQEDVKTAKNYVRAAMGEVLAGKSVSDANTRPYGCSIKY
jgi:peroxiredoxin